MADAGGDPFGAAIVATIRQPLLVLDADLRIEQANRAFREAYGFGADSCEGRLVYDLGEGQWNIPALRRLLSEVLPQRTEVRDYRVEHDFARDGRHVMILNVRRLRLGDRDDRILLAIDDVTERERIHEEIAGRREFADKLIDSVREGLLVLDRGLTVREANRSFYDLFDVAPQETEGRPVWEIGAGQWDIPRLREMLEGVLPGFAAFDDYEVEHDFPRIGRRIMRLNARRIDHLDLIVLAIRDVTERATQERRREVFARELQHRVKNILSNVRAIARHTRRSAPDPDRFLPAFLDRLDALARTQDRLTRGDAEAASLAAIVHEELAAVGAEPGRDYAAEGPELSLTGSDTQAFSMAVHELSTNAAKYGALGVEGGRIDIAWTIEPGPTERLVFRWRESGVPLSGPPGRRGLGSEVIERNIPYMLGGEAGLDFQPDGLACRIAFPLRRR